MILSRRLNSLLTPTNLATELKYYQTCLLETYPNVYRLAEASIFPSLYEGFGIPVLESLACGTPVLTSEQSCMQEIANDAGLYFNPTETDSINEALLTFDKSGIADKLEAAIPDRLELFSNRKILADHNTLYQKICSK